MQLNVEKGNKIQRMQGTFEAAFKPAEPQVFFLTHELLF
jgi:hypothetical protein